MKTTNILLENQTIVLADREGEMSSLLALHIQILEKIKGVMVCAGWEPDNFNHHDFQRLQGKAFPMIAPVEYDITSILPEGVTPGALLWTYLGENPESAKYHNSDFNIPQGTVDLFNTTPTQVVEKVAELLAQSQFTIPDILIHNGIFLTKSRVINEIRHISGKGGNKQMLESFGPCMEITIRIDCDLGLKKAYIGTFYLTKEGKLLQPRGIGKKSHDLIEAERIAKIHHTREYFYADRYGYDSAGKRLIEERSILTTIDSLL